MYTFADATIPPSPKVSKHTILPANTVVALSVLYQCSEGADESVADDDHNINGDLNGMASCVRQSRSQGK